MEFFQRSNRSPEIHTAHLDHGKTCSGIPANRGSVNDKSRPGEEPKPDLPLPFLQSYRISYLNRHLSRYIDLLPQASDLLESNRAMPNFQKSAQIIFNLGEKYCLWLRQQSMTGTPAKCFNRDNPDGINPFAGLRHRKTSPRLFEL